MKRIILLAILLISFSGFSQNEQSSFNVGQKAPGFSAKDQNGEWVKSDDILAQQQLIVVFYRGQWCPYCNKHLKHLQDHVSDFNKAGAKLVAVSPELPVNVDKTVKKAKVKYSVLYDKDSKIMKDFGVDFVLPEKLQEKYKGFGVDLKKAHGNDGQMLPVTATYVIGKDGAIKYVHYDPDFKIRSTAKEILKHLQ